MMPAPKPPMIGLLHIGRCPTPTGFQLTRTQTNSYKVNSYPMPTRTQVTSYPSTRAQTNSYPVSTQIKIKAKLRQFCYTLIYCYYLFRNFKLASAVCHILLNREEEEEEEEEEEDDDDDDDFGNKRKHA